MIPFDLVIEILLRLPVKSIGRFRCVSKLWESTIRSPIFTEPFFTTSLSRPKLLFTGQLDGKTFFFSSVSPQPLNSSTLTASFHMKFPINYLYDICRPVQGLVCGKNQRTFEGRTITVPLVCNPSTGKFLTLPEVKTRKKRVISYLGYDPIGKKFKVLCMTKSYDRLSSEEHQVLTLVTGKELSWRMIKCDIPHHPVPREYIDNRYVYDGMCINGVFYYVALVQGGDRFRGIVCFDIRYEKFKCIRQAYGMKYNSGSYIKSTLVNYKGKLAKLQLNIVDQICIQLWVLEDAEKHQWLKYIYILPNLLKNISKGDALHFVGMTITGEIVLASSKVFDSFYLLYYNPERNTVTRVYIQGMEAFRPQKVYTFLDHVEDVKFMQTVKDHDELLI